MIDEFVKKWESRKHEVRAEFAAVHPGEYIDVVRAVVKILNNDGYNDPDPERIHLIDDGDYQGTLVFVIGCTGYQPDDYWYVKVGYGSCSGCDTLQEITNYSDDPPTPEQVEGYMTLALHVLQGIKKMGD